DVLLHGEVAVLAHPQSNLARVDEARGGQRALPQHLGAQGDRRAGLVDTDAHLADAPAQVLEERVEAMELRPQLLRSLTLELQEGLQRVSVATERLQGSAGVVQQPRIRKD